jgi:hypothetical protein
MDYALRYVRMKTRGESEGNGKKTARLCFEVDSTILAMAESTYEKMSSSEQPNRS